MEQELYTVIAWNPQGASARLTLTTRKAIDEWLSCWLDPENLIVTVWGGSGEKVASKPRGQEIITWPEGPKRSDGKMKTFCFGCAILNFLVALVVAVVDGGADAVGSLAAGLICLTLGLTKL
jgi:hypothetical protein